MAKSFGKADCKGLKALQSRLKMLEKSDLDKFCEAASKELAARLLSLVIPRTPVGEYPEESGKKGGTLRRGWTGGKTMRADEHAQSLSVEKNGSTYTIEVINPVEYASYVEFGHRSPNGGWVKGRYMLTLSEEELERASPALLEKKLMQKLQEVIGG